MTISKEDSLRALANITKLSEDEQLMHLENLCDYGMIAREDIPAILENMKKKIEENNVRYN